MTHADIGERDLSFADLLRFRSKGLIGPVRFGPAAFAIRDHRRWAQMSGAALLALGAGHLVAGLVFYGASQWEDLSEWQIFGILQGGIVVLVAAALAGGLTKPVGQAALIGATLMTGLLLHIVQRIYPSSAGNLEFLLAWALLVLPWVAASRSAAHWVVWTIIALFLADAAFSGYLEPSGLVPAAIGPFVLAAVPGLVLCGGEAMRRRGATWLRPKWPRYVLLAPALGLLFTALLEHLFPDLPVFDGAAAGVESVIIFTIPVLAAIWFYRFRVPDYAGFAIAIAFAALAAGAIGARMIDGWYSLDPLQPSGLFGWLLIFVWASACAGGMAILLRHQGYFFETAEHHAG